MIGEMSIGNIAQIREKCWLHICANCLLTFCRGYGIIEIRCAWTVGAPPKKPHPSAARSTGGGSFTFNWLCREPPLSPCHTISSKFIDRIESLPRSGTLYNIHQLFNVGSNPYHQVTLFTSLSVHHIFRHCGRGRFPYLVSVL